MTGQALAWRLRDDGIEVFVRLTPKSSRDAVDGIAAASDGSMHLKARVRAVPEKGKANQALERLVATFLGVPASSVTVVAGGTSRLKTVRVVADPGTVAGRLSGLAELP